MPKLTDRGALAGVSIPTDLIHVVRDGMSYKREVGNLLTSGAIPWRFTLEGFQIILLKADRESLNFSNVETNDVVICINPTTERMIVAISLGEFSPVLANLEDREKFLRFIDGNALL
jgi:hypothetical protein